MIVPDYLHLFDTLYPIINHPAAIGSGMIYYARGQHNYYIKAVLFSFVGMICSMKGMICPMRG